MARIRSKDTNPEKKVRSLLHFMGYRFRLHRKDLPGNPDIVLPKYKTVIEIHGCFWHRHAGCKRSSMPKTNVDFWKAKFERNVQRDIEKKEALEKLGWKVLILWECEITDLERIKIVLENSLRLSLRPSF